MDKLKEKGYDTVPKEFYDQISIWKSWYDGNVRNFHNYRVFNGQKTVQCHRYTMGMAKKTAEDWANLLMNERVNITLEGKQEQEFFDSVCKGNNFEEKANEAQELKAAFGTVSYVVRLSDVMAREDGRVIGGGEIRIDYVNAPNIFPISWENGSVTECAFSAEKTVDGERYCYLQVHHVGGDGNYIIENSIFLDSHGNLTELPLENVRGFERIPSTVHTFFKKPLFAIDRMNIANNYDVTLPMGIPVFANAIDQLKGVDIAYDSYVNEFVLGKKRIMVKPAAEKNLDGEPYFDVNDLTYYVLPEDTADGDVIHEIDMSLRTQEHNAGLQDMLNALSSRCGFGEGYYRYENRYVQTATQVVSENSQLFRNVRKHEIILDRALKELCRIVLAAGNALLGMRLNESVEISIDFDDSIIEDKNTDFSRDLQLLNAGIMNDYEFRMRWMNEDEETAKAALPKMEDMVTENQYEVGV